jgi:hypothetical protein
MESFVVRGTRVLLTPPVIKESSIEVDEKLKKEILEEQMKKWTRLEVFAVGEDVQDIEVGNEVFVNPMFIRNAENVEIKGEVKIIVRAADISIVWR